MIVTEDTLDLDNRELLRSLDRLARAYQFRDRRRACHHGLSVNECYALQTILRRDGPTQNDLAAVLFLDKSTTSRILAGLEERGIIRREADPDDGRAHRLRATKAGKKLHDRIQRDLLERQKNLIADLPEETRRAAILVMRRLAGMAAKPGDDGAVLRPATTADLPPLRRLLLAESLPEEGVDASLVRGSSVAVRGSKILGSASVEVHGRVGLLRSVVVAREHRGRDWGRRLVADRVDWARSRGLATLVLFTETAAGFFRRLGFRPVARADLPPEVHGSFEFGFCPSQSTSMRLDLDATSRDATGGRRRPLGSHSPGETTS